MKEYICHSCNYKTSLLYNYQRHCNTTRHKEEHNENKKRYSCDFCNRSYKFKQGLYKHMNEKHEKESSLTEQHEVTKDTTQLIPINKDTTTELKDMFLQLMQENRDLQDKLIEITSEPKIIHNYNTQHKTYNIINYLNTECKDALNLTEFIQQMEISFEDIENVKNIGYVSSVKNTFLQSLHNVDEKKRPIHCTDKKRKQFYIKEQDKWAKDVDQKHMRATIEKINNKQLKALETWKNENPNWNNDEYDFDKICDIQRTLLSMYSSREKKDKTVNKIIQQLTELDIRIDN